MRSPMQRKYAAKAAHGARGEQGEKSLPYSIAQARTEEYAAKAECGPCGPAREQGENLPCF